MDWCQWNYMPKINKKLNSTTSLIDEGKIITNPKNIWGTL